MPFRVGPKGEMSRIEAPLTPAETAPVQSTGGRRAKPEDLAEREHGAGEKDRQEIERLREGLAEKQEDEKIKELVDELKKDIEKGSAAMYIDTKIPSGTTYRGYTQERTTVEPGRGYSVRKKGDKAIIPYGVQFPEGWHDQGNVLVYLAPQTESRETVKTFEEKGLLWGTRKVKRKVNEDVTTTLADHGITDQENEKIYKLGIEYLVDNTTGRSLSDQNRRVYTNFRFSLPEKLARNISGEIQDPKKLWKFLEAVDPELMRLVPPLKTPYKPDLPANLVSCELESDQIGFNNSKIKFNTVPL